MDEEVEEVYKTAVKKLADIEPFESQLVSERAAFNTTSVSLCVMLYGNVKEINYFLSYT